ncbi:hypothetical protein [Litoribacterium kuwaitense]|uniref:hypothetical protein n=1 Tax=Litoribacterium kuwaitense TaxID=1398745 RepID=UPI0013EB852D|nr:hypothetical protein [Litoribacterium kuwaitense]
MRHFYLQLIQFEGQIASLTVPHTKNEAGEVMEELKKELANLYPREGIVKAYLSFLKSLPPLTESIELLEVRLEDFHQGA